MVSAQGTSASTDLAKIAVTPIAPAAGAPADWVIVYDYHGGALPLGTRVTNVGKWIDGGTRTDTNGLTFSFPTLPDQPESAQWLRARFAVERPLAAYPTRVTVNFTLHASAFAALSAQYSALDITTSDTTFSRITSLLDIDPLNLDGANTAVLTMDGASPPEVTVNGKPLTGNLAKRIQFKKAGAELLPGIAFSSATIQLPKNQGDWFTVNQVTIEQNRPPLAQSAAARVDLDVTGAAPARVTIEAVSAKNTPVGWVLQDAVVPPGHYTLYWDGVDHRTSQPEGAVKYAGGATTFRLTTSHVQIAYAGEPNNSVPPYNFQSYAQVACTALALTPPGTPAPRPLISALVAGNNGFDPRHMDTTDSVQFLNVGYDACWGGWIGKNGEVFHTKTGDPRMQHGRDVVLTPPDPAFPGDPGHQYLFASTAIYRASGIVNISLPTLKPQERVFTSPDWNHPKSAFSYTIRVGQVPQMLGAKHFIYFRMAELPTQAMGEWSVHNLRFYEAGQPDPGPITFDQDQFTPRNLPLRGMDKYPILPDSVTVEDGGRTVHLKNATSVNYPFEYTVSPNTIMAFELSVQNRGKGAFGEGIGLDSSPDSNNATGNRTFFNFVPGDDRWGFRDETIGAGAMPDWEPNTLYTDTLPDPPAGTTGDVAGHFLFGRGFYGLAVSEDGKLLFACNNADNRLEVRDIAGDGGAVAKIPVDMPMYVALAPEGKAGAPAGTRYIFVDSVTQGLVRIPWSKGNNTFGKPEIITPAAEFVYPRGLAYSAKDDRIFVCDSFTPDRKRVANQLVIVNPESGQVVSHFGKAAGPVPEQSGNLGDDTFSCPLTVVADSTGAIWVNDFYTGEVRKYDYDPAINGLTVERRVMGANTTNTSHFYWKPGDPPTRIWSVNLNFVRTDCDLSPDGKLVNPRATAVNPRINPDQLRPFAHFVVVNGRTYVTFAECGDIYELTGDTFTKRVTFGQNAGEAAREFGLLAGPGAPPTDLDKAIQAANDPDWETRPWVWSDLDGDGQVEYTAAKPEFQIAFGSDLPPFGKILSESPCLRSEDGAFLYPAKEGIVAVSPHIVGGNLAYDWTNAKLLSAGGTLPVVDVMPQDGRIFTLGSSSYRHDVGATIQSELLACDRTGKPIWSRGQSDYSLVSLEPVGPGLVSTLERSYFNGQVDVRTTDGDLVCRVFCRDCADCWSQGTLRVDPDTAYIGYVQAYKLTGLSTIKSAQAIVNLPAA